MPAPLAPVTRFVLVNTSHAGNVGAAARAIKVMGFDELVLVAPRYDDVLGHDEALAMASGATDVLVAARVVATLAESLQGILHVCATAMTPRDFGPPTAPPREHFATLVEAPPNIAFVFGGERFGLANDDVYRCHQCLSIPTAPGYHLGEAGEGSWSIVGMQRRQHQMPGKGRLDGYLSGRYSSVCIELQRVPKEAVRAPPRYRPACSSGSTPRSRRRGSTPWTP